MVVIDLDAADEFAVEAGFVGDGADQVGRLHVVGVADFDAVGLQVVVAHRGARRAAVVPKASPGCAE